MAGEMPFHVDTGSVCTAASDTLSTADAAIASAVLGRVETEQLGRAGCRRDRQLQRMIEPAAHHRNLCAETTLDLVGDRESEQEVRPAGIDVFGDGEHRAEVVGGMTQTTGCQVGVEQIGIAHQHRIEEGRLVHRGAATAHEGRGRAAAELFGVGADGWDRARRQGHRSRRRHCPGRCASASPVPAR